MRAHANCVENLPVFATIVLVASSAHLSPPNMVTTTSVTMAARTVQTPVHMLLPGSNASIALRFTFFLLQVLAMIAMAILVATAATTVGTR